MSTKKKIPAIVAATGLAVVIIGVLAFQLLDCSNNGTSSSSSSNGIHVVLEDVQVEKVLGSYPEEFLDTSMPWRASERANQYGISDAVSFAFTQVSGKRADEVQSWYSGLPETEKAKLIAAVYDELCEEIARNPVYADMWARALLSETTTATLSPETVKWLAEFVAKTDAARANSHPEQPLGWEYWLESRKEQDGNIITHLNGRGEMVNTIFVTPAYRMYAAGIISILDYLVKDGVESPYALSWYLPWDARAAFVRAEFGRTEDLPALVLQYRMKDGSIALTLYVNLFDKRVEVPSEPPTQPGNPNPDAPTPPGPSNPKDPTQAPQPAQSSDWGSQAADPVGPTLPSNPPPTSGSAPNPNPTPVTPPATNPDNHSGGGGTQQGGDGGATGGTGSSSSDKNQTIDDGEVVDGF